MLLFNAHLHNENLLIMATNFTAYTTNIAAEQQPHPTQATSSDTA